MRQWTIELPAKTVTVQTARSGTVFRATLDRAAITATDFAGRLAAVGAQFAYLLDPDGLEGRVTSAAGVASRWAGVGAWVAALGAQHRGEVDVSRT